MKKSVLLMLFLVVVSSVNAIDYLLEYDGWVTSNDKFEVKDETLRMIHIRNPNTTVVYFPNGLNVVINPGNETCDDEWLYEVCVKNIKYEKNGEEVPPDINDYNIDISVYLNVSIADIGLVFEREFEEKDLLAGETLDITTTITKKGKEQFTNVSYVDVFSKDFDLVVYSGCIKKGNKIIWTSDLMIENNHECKYSIRGLRETEYENNASLSYVVLGRDVSEKLENMFKVDTSAVLFDLGIERDNQSAGENNKILLNIEALKDAEVSRLDLTLPDHFKIVNISPEFRVENEKYVIKGLSLIEDDELDYFVEFTTGFQGNHSVKSSLSYTYGGVIKNINQEVVVEITGITFYLSLFQRNNLSIIQVLNPSTKPFREIWIQIANESFYVQKIDPRRFKELEFPILENKTYSVKLKYRTEFGQLLEETYGLKYGVSTFKGEEQLEKQEEEQEDVVIEKKKKLDINIDPRIVYAVFGSILVALSLFFIISKIKNKAGKSDLDKEIDKIRNEARKL